MIIAPHGGPGRAARFAAAVLSLAAAGCQRPDVGARAGPSETAAGPAVEIHGAWLLADRVVADFSLSRDGRPAGEADAAALAPRFTLAALGAHPVDGFPAWESLLPTGAQVAPRLPPGGPGTPDPEILTSVRQPGSESWIAPAGSGAATGTLQVLGAGRFAYTFAQPLAPEHRGTTVRVGVWLEGAAAGTARTSSTFDFRPDGGAAQAVDAVLDERCGTCHGTLVHHGRRSGVRLCATCHTWQNVDPDTVDPAALDGASAATDPNPLELGRMIHRIHRGRNLPTLYAASSTDPAPELPPGAPPPLPFFPGRNTAVSGRKYAVVGEHSREVVYGCVKTRTDNGQSPGKVVASGVVFPRELRDCEVCHGGAPQASRPLEAVSRRTCSGCHPDVWYAPPNGDGTTSITDAVHFAHTGGPQANDGECAGCHVAATPTQPKVWAPIAEIHVPPHRSPRFDRPVVEIVRVENARPGSSPTVKFKLYDRLGTFSQVGAYPAPAPEPGGSVLPRTMHYLAGGWFGITIAGPTVPAFGLDYLLSEREDLNELFELTPDAEGVFAYPFTAKLPAGARGTWAVGIEARRRGTTTHYDAAAQEFRWPYTGEALTEPPLNPVVYVDTATGTFEAGVPDAAVPRRRIVAQEKCDRCHDPIPVHGSTRMRVEYCVVCHGPDRTDWGARPKVDGRVDLSATYDGIEERSIDFKVMIHRIHTGGRRGPASLEGIEPHVIYGRYGSVFFFDEGLFPGDLANCTSCHEGKTYTVDSVPPDAPPTRANETPTVLHAAGEVAHPSHEPAVPPVQAACLGCHASSATREHARRNTIGGAEQCANCHVRGALSVDVVHGLAPLSGGVDSRFSSIVQQIFVPRCATAACHSGEPPVASPRLDASAAYGSLVGVPSGQAAMNLVEPGAPERSYLLYKLRGEAASGGGSGLPMPTDGLLDPADIAAIEAWIANGAPND